MERCTRADKAAQTHNAVGYPRVVEDTSVGNYGVIYLSAINFRPGQKAWPAENRRCHVEEIKARQLARYIQISFEKCADSSNVLPITLKDRRIDFQVLDGLWDNVFAEIGERVIQQAADDVAVEDVNAHRGEEQVAVAFDVEPGIPLA